MAWLLGRDIRALERDLAEIARRNSAVVTCYGFVSSPSGRMWRIDGGSGGLATGGSGDVLAGAVAGFCARGASLEQAAVWGSHLHAAAGDRLAASVGALGYLASELLPELPRLFDSVARD